MSTKPIGSSRREFTKQALSWMATVSLFDLVACGSPASSAGPSTPAAKKLATVTSGWVDAMNELSRDCHQNKITQVQWSDQSEALMNSLDIEEFMSIINYEEILTRVPVAPEHGHTDVRFPMTLPDGRVLETAEHTSTPGPLSFGWQAVAVEPGRSLPAHGHNNVTSLFWVLEGEVDAWHYNRLDTVKKGEEEFFLIQQSREDHFGRGGFSTVSDERDNVHWFKNNSNKRAMFLNVHVLGTVEGVPWIPRMFVDPDGEKLADSQILAPRMSEKDALLKYG